MRIRKNLSVFIGVHLWFLFMPSGSMRGNQPGPSVVRSHTVAITFSSMAIGVGRQLISNVVRHGGSFSKYSFHSRL